jgi:hypothetical protein
MLGEKELVIFSTLSWTLRPTQKQARGTIERTQPPKFSQLSCDTVVLHRNLFTRPTAIHDPGERDRYKRGKSQCIPKAGQFRTKLQIP